MVAGMIDHEIHERHESVLDGVSAWWSSFLQESPLPSLAWFLLWPALPPGLIWLTVVDSG